MNIQNAILFTVIFGFNIINANIQSIEVANDSDQPVHITANSKTQSLNLSYSVPSHAHSIILSQVTKLKTPQERLFEAILADSVVELRKAIELGANINLNIEGKSPISWAMLFKRYNTMKYLITLGASF